ncbi:MAG: ABC transporter ATP-binding protein [Rhizobiales bacterium]|nr:ABC transporter ATP-binding protein [Hyphomicrobiales bacterium]
MLIMRAVETGYGDAQALFGVDLTIDEGEVVTLLGRNGMGKTTTIRALMGLLPVWKGSVEFDGQDLTKAQPFVRAQAGIGLVPEGRQVFPTLTVEENLIATAADRFGSKRWHLDRIWQVFPRLLQRRTNRGNELSGGEQQMLAIGRALMTNPKLLVLDEATEGLAPLIRADIWACIAALKAEGEAILVIDKTIQALTSLADRHVVIEKGRVVWTGTNDEFLADHSITDRYLHL